MQAILEQAFKGCIDRVADDLRLHVRSLYRWVEDGPNPVDSFTKLVRILFLHNPSGAALVMTHVNGEYEALLAKHDKRPTGRQIEVSLHKETSEAVMALLAGRPVAEVRKEVLEARAAADATLRYLDQLEAEEAERRKQPRLKAVNN